MSHEPKILGFLCNWCSYSAADLAGASRLTHPPNVDVVRVMCTGRVDPVMVLRAFRAGMDGVLVCGCHPGDCHYVNGNCRASGRLRLLRNTINVLGIDPARLRLEWIGASERERFVQVVTEMTETLRALGPLGAPGPSSSLSAEVTP